MERKKAAKEKEEQCLRETRYNLNNSLLPLFIEMLFSHHHLAAFMPPSTPPDADESLCAVVLAFFQPFDLFRNRPENSFVRALTELEMLEKVFCVSGSYSGPRTADWDSTVFVVVVVGGPCHQNHSSFASLLGLGMGEGSGNKVAIGVATKNRSNQPPPKRCCFTTNRSRR